MKILAKLASFEEFQQVCIKRLELFLDTLLPLSTTTPLFEAMRYAVLNGGKRIRPLLVYATGKALGCTLTLLDAPAAAVELIHCYSLIHDDLPAMDNDDLRRGKPTCHKVFGEATAILAGDALLTLAFQVLSDPVLNPISPEQKIQMLQVLAEKSGRHGMVGGQALDLASEGKGPAISIDLLTEIHQKKTGALIEAAVTLGALSANSNLKTISALQQYARCIGLAFQVQDDILDATSHSNILGKTSGKDEEQNKATFVRQLGIEKSQQYAQKLHQEALEAIKLLDIEDNHLVTLAEHLINRTY